MKIFYIVLIPLFFVKCQLGNKVKGDDMFLSLNAISNTVSFDTSNIIYSNWDTSICVYNLEKKLIIFRKKAMDTCYAKPIVKNGKIYFPFSNDKFFCRQICDDKLLWELDLKGMCSNFDFIDDTTIIASTKHNGLIMFNAEHGKILSELKYNYENTQLPDLSPWLVSYDSQNFYVSNWQGYTLSSFKKKDGTINWQFANKDFGLAGQSFLLGHKIFIGVNEAYKDGKLIVLDKSNGAILHKQGFKYEDQETPIFYNDIVYFYSYDRCINAFDISTYNAKRLKWFEKDFDLSGNQMFLSVDKIYFSDNSFFLNSYSINDNTLKQIQKTEKSIISVYTYKEKRYFIN